MRHSDMTRATLLLAAAITLGGCDSATTAAAPTDPSRIVAEGASTARGSGKASPQEEAVRAAMENLKQWIVERNVAALSELWTDDYQFINPQGGLVTREQRIANLTSGNTSVQIIDNEREITVRVYGDMAIV